MKASVTGVDGNQSGEIELPGQFSIPLRNDLVKRAFWIVYSHSMQPYGRDPMAGMRTSAETSNPPTGRGVARIPRVKGGGPRSGQGGGIASVVGGRTPHAPRSEKVLHRKINKQESGLALASAIAFTADKESVVKRGHKIGDVSVPIVVSDDLEAISKASELEAVLEKLGLEAELERVYGGVKKRSGKPALRGRTKREKVGPLIVVANDRGVGRAASSIPGVDVAPAESLSVLNLVPGGDPGRLTVWTQSAIEWLRKSGGDQP